MFNQTISDIFGMKVYPSATVGIEVEMEFSPLGPIPRLELEPVWWSVIADGSLAHGLEAISKPLTIGEKHFSMALTNLDNVFATAKPLKSERTSIHVHLNATNKTLLAVVKGSCTLWLLENILFRMCAEHRRNNHFCIGLSDTIALVEELARLFKEGKEPYIRSDEFKYSSLNWGRMDKLGTVESRIKEGSISAADISSWARMLAGLFERGCAFPGTPTDLIQFASEEPLAFIQQMFGQDLPIALHALDDDVQEACMLVQQNVVLLLPFFGVDWEKDYTKKVKKAPAAWQPALPPLVRPVDDIIFEEDVVVEFGEADIVQDNLEEERLAAAEPKKPKKPPIPRALDPAFEGIFELRRR